MRIVQGAEVALAVLTGRFRSRRVTPSGLNADSTIAADWARSARAVWSSGDGSRTVSTRGWALVGTVTDRRVLNKTVDHRWLTDG